MFATNPINAEAEKIFWSATHAQLLPGNTLEEFMLWGKKAKL